MQVCQAPSNAPIYDDDEAPLPLFALAPLVPQIPPNDPFAITGPATLLVDVVVCASETRLLLTETASPVEEMPESEQDEDTRLLARS